MQRVDIEKKTFVALVDADGCFYNLLVEALLYDLIVNYSDDIDAISLDATQVNDLSKKIGNMKSSIKVNAKLYGLQFMQSGNIHITDFIFKSLSSKKYQYLIDQELNVSVAYQLKIIYANWLCNVPELKEVYQALLLAANDALFSHLNEVVRNGCYHQMAFMSGSNRQSRRREVVNILNNGTRAFVIDLSDLTPVVAKSINVHSDKDGQDIACHFDGFLLADIYAGKDDGHSFNLMLQEVEQAEDDHDELPHHDYVFDETKFTLVYAMLHRAAVRYEGHNITVAFFDDRVDIHDVIKRIFAAHPDLIPANVTLECWHYRGMKIGYPLAVIQGEGVIDHHFRENIKKIIEICGFSVSNYKDPINTGAVILADVEMPLLAAFKELRALHHPEQHEFASMFQHALTLFSHPEASRSAAVAAVDDARPENQVSSSLFLSS